MKKRNIFQKRLNYKPFEYPEVQPIIDAMNKTFWVHSEIDFTADVQDYNTQLNDIEREIFKRSALSISQVEVAVKTFWADLYKHFPKPEINGLGVTLAESEHRHSESYSRLLEVMGYNNEFEKLYDIPIFKEKLDLLENSLTGRKDILEKLIFFTIVIENASLFSQFANIMSLMRFKGLMKNTTNLINYTVTEEDLHKEAGILLVNIIKEEQPNYFNDMSKHIIKDVHKYIEYESKLLDWIFEKGELEFYSKEDLLNFMKYRVDLALEKMGFEKQFNITKEQYKPMEWFDEETKIQTLTDFFAQRPVEYSKHNQAYTSNNLF